MIVVMWKIFVKAGKPGWGCIVPIYSTILQLEIAGRPIWWIFLMLIPFVNIVVSIIVILDFAKAFGKGTGFGCSGAAHSAEIHGAGREARRGKRRCVFYDQAFQEMF